MVFEKDTQYYRFCLYGFLKNLRFFEPFLILFFLEKGFSFLQIGILYSILEITRNIFEIPSGFLSDILGRRKTLASSFGVYIVSFVVFYYSEEYVFLALSMILFALGDAFRTGTHKAMIFAYLTHKGWKDQKVHYYGNTRSWSQMGSAISSLVAGAIVFYQGNYRSIFLIAIIPYVIDMVNVATYPKVLEGNSLSSKNRKKIAKKVWQTVRESFTNTSILKSLANTSSYSGFYKAVKDYLQPFIKTMVLATPLLLAYSDKQRAAIFIGIIYFVLYFVTSMVSRRSGKFKDRFSTFYKPLNFTLVIGFAIGILGGIAFGYELYALAILFFIGIFLMENLRKPIGMAYLANKLDDKAMATALSVESQIKSLFAAFIAPLLGYLSDCFGIGIGLSIIAGLLLMSSWFYLAEKTDE